MSATLFIAALAVAQPLHVWEPVKFNPAPGTKLTYKSTSSTTFEGMGQSFTTSISETASVEHEAPVDGWIKVKNTVLEHKVDSDMPFGETPDPTGMATSVLVSTTRKQKDLKFVANGKMTTEQIDAMKTSSKNETESGFEGLLFPEGDLKVDQTWSFDHAPAGVGMAGMPTTTTGKVKTTYKILAINGTDIVIEAKTAGTYQMTISTPDGEFSMSNTMDETRKYTVRKSDGVLIKTESNSVLKMASDFGEFSTSSKSTTELQKS